MVKQHFAPLLADEPAWRARAERLAERTHEFATFLVDRLNVDIAGLLRFDEPVTFHYPCHARGIYGAEDLQRWLTRDGQVNLRLPQHVDCCCGFGGMFAVDYPEISTAMLNDKLDLLADTGARLVICNEGGCTLQMAGGARRRGLPLRFKHIAECLADSLGLMKDQP
jgi:L-lactate dehydrogenase complex protein LldE